MSTQLLPSAPNLEHLKKQAKDLLEAQRTADPDACALISEFHPRFANAPASQIRQAEVSLSDTQLVIARRYSFPSWPKLKHFLDTYDTEAISDDGQRLKTAIDQNDIEGVRRLVAINPDLLYDHVRRSKSFHYTNYRPLTYACAAGRVEVARALIEAGADVHEDGDLPVARGSGSIPVMELLIARGVDINTKAYDWGPLILYPCEGHDLKSIQWMLAHDADPNRVYPGQRSVETALSMVLRTYVRSDRMQACVEALVQGGAEYNDSPLFDLLRGRRDLLKERLDANPALVHRHFSIEDGRMHGGFYGGAPLAHTTLLHYCGEYNLVEEAEILLEYGADVNARAKPSLGNLSDHTPIYHTVASNWNFSYPMLELLLEHGADLSARVTVQLPNRETQGQDGRLLKAVTPLGYARRYPEAPYDILDAQGKKRHQAHEQVIELLQNHGAPE